KRWLTLILQSRDLSPSAVQQVSLTDSQTRLLLQACNASFQIDRVNLTLAEDLADEIAPAFSHLHFLPEGLFVHLDDCSPKAGAQIIPDRKSLHTIDKFILRIVTSGRFQAALEVCEKSQRSIELFYLPFDIQMTAERECRVFCRPKNVGSRQPVSIIGTGRGSFPNALASNKSSILRSFMRDHRSSEIPS
ncbi:uncharacterized protein CCOS01_10017, partial [Colletotrichum costaricense]